MIDKLFMLWCCTHGRSVTDPRAMEEYGLWNAETEAYNVWDCDSDGHWSRVTGEDILGEQLQRIEDEMSAAEAGC